ncbi:DUF4249 domain-containing protein [Puia dinghuensis]|uniref:DUF4249 domain-containing protein n=1 Tax=Puia dinghuensis TaxID=1792502 RepID=A0A8J2UCM0_9BACT|nr:DUF4249 domain-containing protein [Puia dinghuensis]GGA96085.1 hypothetical protein GCM10011511_19210 [Puia dinghuensis]
MQQIQNIILTILLALPFCACQRVISVPLDPGATKYVIEGVVTDEPGGSSVSITQTKDFSANNTFAGVSGATVTIENNGSSYLLTESSPGVYTTSALTGVPGNTYYMKVVLNGVIYTATSTMPNPVVGMDSIYVSNGTLTDKRYVTVVFTDPAGIPNYYRWVQYVNGRQEKTNFLGNDEFTDGLRIKDQLEFNNDTNDRNRDIKTGDSVRIDMINIDSAVFQYWYALQRNADGSGQSASPANPTGNIAGGCLGYFSAQGVRTKSLLVGKE